MKVGVLGIERIELLGPTLRHFTHVDDAMAREEEVLRIEVAQLDEALGLPGAAARIGCVDQAALALHEVAQVAPRSGELLTEVVAGDVEQLGSDAIGDPEDLTEHVDEALLAIEAEQHGGRAADLRFLDQQQRIGLLRLGRDQIGLRRARPVRGRSPRRSSSWPRHGHA